MNLKEAIAKSVIFRKIYQIAVLLLKAIAKPKYILLCFWAFKQLWWIDSRLKEMALTALKSPVENNSDAWTPQLQKATRQRAIAIAWTAKIHPLRPKCLHRSLVLYHWLKMQGINPKLEIGWGKEQKIAHAWVTYNGRVLNDRADIAQFTPSLTTVQK
jgi:hypothetical protein